MDLEQAYQTFCRSIESVNVVVATYKDDLLGDVQVYPEKGTVGFGSGLHGWGFTIAKFAKMYSSKFGIDKTKMMGKLVRPRCLLARLSCLVVSCGFAAMVCLAMTHRCVWPWRSGVTTFMTPPTRNGPTRWCPRATRSSSAGSAPLSSNPSRRSLRR